MKKFHKNFLTCIFITSVLSIFIFLFFYKSTADSTIESIRKPHPKHVPSSSIKKDKDICQSTESASLSDFDEGEWQLIWHDEFNNECLDLTKWSPEDWAAEKNNELQYYTPDNVKVEDGVLKLVSKQERFKGRDFTSGAVQTKGKFDVLYGKIEMRAKLPAGQGVFPAFWTITEKENTWLPEIDIMEMLGHQPNEVWMVVHWLDENGTLRSDHQSFSGSDFSKDFHTFSVVWTPESITWFVDNVERFKTNAYVPHEPMYLYLNTAIGGDWPGSPDATTPFPVTYEIDYVRVFTKLSN